MTAKIIYEGGLRTSALHVHSNTTIYTDAPLDNKGRGEAFSPTDLMSTSLACCMLTIMGIAAETHQIEMTGTTVTLQKVMHPQPRKVKEIILEFQFPKITYSDKEKAILEHAARTCPVALSLHPELVQTIKFTYLL